MQIHLKSRSKLLVVVSLLSLTLCTGSLMAQTPAQQPSIPIGAGYVILDPSTFDVYGNVQAFIETGSLSPLCLVTFNESNFAGAEGPVFCNARQFGGKKGIRVTFGFPFGVPPSDFILSLTVYQPSAHGYGQPVLYTGL